MRTIPILSAALVILGLYIMIFERDRLFQFARGGPEIGADITAAAPPTDALTDGATDAPTDNASATAPQDGAPEPDTATMLVSVIALRSTATTVDNMVLLRGRTEASRQVTMKAETSGQVVSDPLRKGSHVATGDLLCKLDSGISAARLTEARARLAEARTRIPASQAALAEAISRIPAMEAALAQAESQVPAAQASLAQAESQVPTSQAALAQAESQVPASEAALAEALSRVTAAEAALADAKTRPTTNQARVAEAEARLSEAEIAYNAASKLSEEGFASDTRVANALSTLQSARAGVQSAISQLESARAGVLSAESQIEGAKAGVQAALSQLEGARAGVQSANSQIEAAKAGVQAALSQIDAAQAGIASAESQIEGAAAGVQSAKSGVENAKAGVQSAEASVAAAEREITKLEIHAPFAGLLETDTAELGSLLQPGAPCATIVQIDPIKLVGFVPETQISKVQPGVLAGGRLTSGQDLMGRVSFLSRVSDPLTRTFRVEVEVPNTDQLISDGLTVEILISADGTAAHLLPQSALTLDDGGILGVRLVVEGHAQFAPVTLLRDTREGVWVGGLAPDVEVIVTGQEYVSDGVALDVTYREPDA